MFEDIVSTVVKRLSTTPFCREDKTLFIKSSKKTHFHVDLRRRPDLSHLNYSSCTKTSVTPERERQRVESSPTPRPGTQCPNPGFRESDFHIHRRTIARLDFTLGGSPSSQPLHGHLRPSPVDGRLKRNVTDSGFISNKFGVSDQKRSETFNSLNPAQGRTFLPQLLLP